jgi:hypothetical protein
MAERQELSLIEAYLVGAGQLVAWLLPAVVTGIVVALAQRVFLPDPPTTRGGNQ